MGGKTMDTMLDVEQGRFVPSKEQLEHANINPVTKLATDYLNHFNEVIMLIDMLAMMPECCEDVLQWAPKSYPDHFEDSGFAERDLAILAYDLSPYPIRHAFDKTVSDIDQVIFRVQGLLRQEGHMSAQAEGTLSFILSEELRPLMARASGIVNGTLCEETILPTERAQDAVDALFS